MAGREIEARLDSMEATQSARLDSLVAAQKSTDAAQSERLAAMEAAQAAHHAAMDSRMAAMASRMNDSGSQIAALRWFIGVGFALLCILLTVLHLPG